jgi:Uma2 family endonuclease
MSIVVDNIVAEGDFANLAGPNGLANGDSLYEIVNGQRMEKHMGVRETRLGNFLARWFSEALGKNPPGEAFHEMLFRLRTDPKLDRRPDVAYVPYERWPERIVPEVEAWEVIPAVAVEIISKTNTAVEVLAKIEEYFEHGVSQVWVIYPSQRKIHIYESPKSIRVLDEKDTLEGGSVIPGLHLPAGRIFSLLEKSAE